MAVILKGTLLWQFPVPYEPVENVIINKSIQVLNDAVGFGLFVPYTDQPHHVQFNVDTSQACSLIGCSTNAKQTINLKSTSEMFACLHEMMHCLGFEHEQFHPKYPWDATDKAKKNPFYNVDAEVSVAQASSVKINVDTTNWNPEKKTANWGTQQSRSLVPDLDRPKTQKTSKPELPFTFKIGSVNQLLYEYLAGEMQSTGAQSFWEQLAVKGPGVVPQTALCDYDSIMMYGDFERAAVFAASKGKQISIERTGKCADQNLSRGDVTALLDLYGKFK